EKQVRFHGYILNWLIDPPDLIDSRIIYPFAAAVNGIFLATQGFLEGNGFVTKPLHKCDFMFDRNNNFPNHIQRDRCAEWWRISLSKDPIESRLLVCAADFC